MLKHRLILKLFPLLFFLFFASAQEAHARCWGFNGLPAPCPFLFLCTDDGYDIPVGLLSASDNPQDPETPVENDNCPESGTTDPVNLSNGQYYYNCNNLQIPGRKLDLETMHTYNSGSTFN